MILSTSFNCKISLSLYFLIITYAPCFISPYIIILLYKYYYYIINILLLYIIIIIYKYKYYYYINIIKVSNLGLKDSMAVSVRHSVEMASLLQQADIKISSIVKQFKQYSPATVYRHYRKPFAQTHQQINASSKCGHPNWHHKTNVQYCMQFQNFVSHMSPLSHHE